MNILDLVSEWCYLQNDCFNTLPLIYQCATLPSNCYLVLMFVFVSRTGFPHRLPSDVTGGVLPTKGRRFPWEPLEGYYSGMVKQVSKWQCTLHLEENATAQTMGKMFCMCVGKCNSQVSYWETCALYTVLTVLYG